MSAIAAHRRPGRPVWRRLIGFNLLTGDRARRSSAGSSATGSATAIHAPSLDYFADTGQNDISIMLGYLFGVIGFLIGLGFANYPVRRLLGHPPTLAEHEDEGEGIGRYFRLCTDHKVVGDAVHGRDRRVLLRRRAQRDADPHRAAAAQRRTCSAPTST